MSHPTPLRTDSERELIERIDRAGGTLSRLVVDTRAELERAYTERRAAMPFDAQYRLIAAEPERWIDIASDHLQQGLMALRRSIERPQGF